MAYRTPCDSSAHPERRSTDPMIFGPRSDAALAGRAFGPQYSLMMSLPRFVMASAVSTNNVFGKLIHAGEGLACRSSRYRHPPAGRKGRPVRGPGHCHDMKKECGNDLCEAAAKRTPQQTADYYHHYGYSPTLIRQRCVVRSRGSVFGKPENIRIVQRGDAGFWQRLVSHVRNGCRLQPLVNF